MKVEQIRAAFSGVNFTPVEKAAIEWQYRACLELGGFRTALWQAIDQADPHNLAKLEAGFPAEVTAVRRWRSENGFAGHLRDRIESLDWHDANQRVV